MGNDQSYFHYTYKSAVEGHNYDYNPEYNQDHIYADYTQFYVGIGIIGILAFLIGLLNCFFYKISNYKRYWLSHNSGNRLALPIFILPPKNQKPFDI